MRIYRIPEVEIEPGAKRTFAVRLVDPPEPTQNVEVTFVLDGSAPHGEAAPQGSGFYDAEGNLFTATRAAFVEYLRSPAAQRIFAQEGYRPVDEKVLAEFDFPQPKGLFEISDLGGWPKVMTDFFDKDKGVVAGINRELGVPVDG